MYNFMDQIIFFIFSFKFHFLPTLEHCRLCLCGGLLHSSEAPSHPLQRALVPSKFPEQSQVPSSSVLLVRSCCSHRAPRACPHCHHISPGRKSITPTHCAQAQQPSLCPIQCCPQTHTQRKMRSGLLHTLCDSEQWQGPCPQHGICHPASSSGISMPVSAWGKRAAHYNALHNKASN